MGKYQSQFSSFTKKQWFEFQIFVIPKQPGKVSRMFCSSHRYRGARAHSRSKSDFLQPNYPPKALLGDRSIDLTVTAWPGNLGCATVVKALPRKARGSFNCCVLRRREIAAKLLVGWRQQQPLGPAPEGLVVVRAAGDLLFHQTQQ